MSDFVEHAPCENFEANVFAKSRCQNCFRAVGAHHQPSNQLPEEHAVEAPHGDATSGPDPGGLWDPLCILAPQCELYVCAGFKDRTEDWQESLAYTQLSSRAQGEHEETSTRTDISTDTSTGTSATLSGDWEMTRLLDSILVSDKQDTMNYAGQRKEVQIGALQSDRPRWGQTISWGRTESQSFMKEISPQKAESSPLSQSTGDGWAKHQMETSYFSLERRKSDPNWVSFPPRASNSTLPTRNDPVRTGRHLTSSISSLDFDLPGCKRGGGEGRHALVRQEYTVLADLPKPKRISHREAFEQERSSSRTRSPGRAEVERIFGYERRRSETLEVFQALEDGLLDRLDGKTPLLAKEGRLGRSQSSPTLYKEGNKRPREQLEQPGRCQGEALRSVSPAQRSERDWRSRVGSMCHSQLDRGTTRPFNSASSMGSQDLYLNTNGRCHKPDLLNFKKGWMSILDELGEWKKHWFVLTDSSLRYYRDSNAEEADELDGEIDLRSCTEVTEYAVQRNYGFQIHTKDATFTLSAMTSGIRRNWIEALRKTVRPASAPDVTKLSDCNKENSIRSCVPQKGSLRSEEHWPGLGSEVISKGSNRKADGPRHTFDYVELAPWQQGPLNHGAPQRTRGSLRGISDRVTKHENLERDLALRSEERRKWFEAPDTGLLQGDGPAGALCWKACEQELLGPALSEDQRSRLSEEIEKKWLELERLPLKESKRLPLTALLNQSKGGYGDTREALEKEVQSLRAQLESWRARGESLRDTGKSHGDGHMPQGFISQEACERSLAEMESLHQQVMTELQRHHQRELERLRQEKERLLAEEAAATAAAIEALKKVHKEELNRELGRTRSFQQSGSGSEALRRQHQLDVDSLKRELQVLSEQYSQKCLEIGDLTEKAEEREQMLQRCQQEGKELLRQNQELQTCLSEEIQRLRTFITSQGTGDGALHNGERSSCELEVLLRVKENELQYLKKEVQCLKDELQMMQKDKRFASGKYQDVYVELNHIKLRSEREIEQLKEHLRLAMAALQEKETLRNSISE
ncbi:TRIO and F-actin-binding protein isoform X2 [Gopherus evgoodei]|uniref:TRIO and F-actin-binding protein isoform X2 n=1 Tax=Gopherus evgoodei TaxID=1825980 RepID=UPI0011CFCCF1|nr:TRIO and F-actin-binding protein isoform X2 [Gopherus evgoodei]